MRGAGQEGWAKAQAQIAATKNAPRKTPVVSKHEHMLSGLLRCGQCGATMSIVSRAYKNGRSWSNYGCSARHQKGDVVCTNNRTISELRVERKLLTELRAFAQSPKLDEWIDNGIARARAKQSREADDELSRLQAQVRVQEHQVAKATDILFQVGVSEALKARLQTEEAKLRELRAKMAGHPSTLLPRRSGGLQGAGGGRAGERLPGCQEGPQARRADPGRQSSSPWC